MDLIFSSVFSPFYRYVGLKLRWSAIKFWSTLMHMHAVYQTQ